VPEVTLDAPAYGMSKLLYESPRLSCAEGKNNREIVALANNEGLHFLSLKNNSLFIVPLLTMF